MVTKKKRKPTLKKLSARSVGGAQQNCAANKRQTSRSNVVAAAASVSSTSPTKTCKLLKASISDPEGRVANAEGLLYVVSKSTGKFKMGDASETSISLEHAFSAKSENISASASYAGGCASHFSWRIEDESESVEIKNGKLAKDVMVAQVESRDFPMDYPMSKARLTAQCCQGGPLVFSVTAVPGDEIKTEIVWDKLTKPFFYSLERIYKISPGEDGEAETNEENESERKFEISQCWKEDEDSHLIYCESTLKASLSPLLSLSGKFMPYGLPVPSRFSAYLAAGIFITLEFLVELNGSAVIKTWVDDAKPIDLEGNLKGEAKASVELSVEATLLSEDIMAAEVRGKTEMTGTGGLVVSPAPASLVYELAWDGLMASIKMSFAMGLIEYEREWEVHGEEQISDASWPLKNLLS
jgi:hypothetical protein